MKNDSLFAGIPRSILLRGRCIDVAFLLCLCAQMPVQAALLDVWKAGDLNTLNEGDAVGSWTSASNRTATASVGAQPVLRKNATPSGSSVVRFSGGQLLSAANSPAGGRSAFSVALVFKATAPGANNSGQWWGKTGLIDAEEPGVTADWGTVINESGQVGIGTGQNDATTFSAGPSLVGSDFHVAVFTWGGGNQSVYVDNQPAVSQSGVSTALRNSAGIAIGGIRTGEGNRRFAGDMAEIRFYDAALNPSEASVVINELRDTHLFANVPRIFNFSAATNQIYLGDSVLLSWAVSNATGVAIDSGIGTVSANGTRSVNPQTNTTYTLTATNTAATRSATVTVIVDPGIPRAIGFSTNVVQDGSVALVLRGSDPNGGALTYAITVPPALGTLSGTPPNLTYTARPGLSGSDSFRFKVNDGMFDSPEAVVSVKIIPPPTAPSQIILSSTNISSRTGPGGFIAALRAVDVNEEDTHTFALVPGFGDNSRFTLSGNILSAGPSFAGGIGARFTVRLRTTDSTGRSYEQTFELPVVETRQNVIFNEVHYNPRSNTVHESFIELFNPTDTAVDLSQWRLRGGVDFVFPANVSIPPNGYLVIAEDPATLQARYGLAAFGPWSGGLNNDGEEITLRDPSNQAVDRVDYRSAFPWPVLANGEGYSMQLVNSALDNDLGSSWRSASPPTPGARNAAFATNAAPNIRQVRHTPQQPTSSNAVVITARVTDPEGVASVLLSYQVIAPGSFLPAILPLNITQLNSLNTNPALTNALNPAYYAASNWTSIAMYDVGLDGDEVAGDSIYTVRLPAQAHRTLVRYRITVSDTFGLSRRAPFEDDPSLNFAYFVYNGIPAYQGYSSNILQTLPVYWLITRSSDIDQTTAWQNTADQIPAFLGSAANDGRLHFNWEGAMVYDGVVYDHIRYRLRGANGRYHSGKRSFRFKFNMGKLLEAKDQFGRPYPTKWRELTTGKGQSNRGSETYGLNEVVNYFLWNKVNVPAPLTHHLHLRVVRGANEAPDAYNGDFWGMTWAQEKYDVRFLDAHNLPKGNLYKLNDHRLNAEDELRYQGPNAPENGADFWNIQNNLKGTQSTEWLLAHVNYTNWYRYHAISEAIRHYDIWPSANKNGVWYFEPIYTAANNYLGRMMTLPYDTTDTWGPTWNGGQDIAWNGIFPSTFAGGDSGQNLELQKEYRNTVREIRDLFFQPDQIGAVIDAFAAPLLPFSPADQARWLNAPAPASYTSLTIGGPGLSGGVAGQAQDMKNFMFTGGNNAWWIDRQSVGAGGWVTRLDQVAADPAVPNRPVITYAGTNGFPVNGLFFRSSAFADPQGPGTFAAMQWRVAEVLSPGSTATNPNQLKLEWDAAWQSGELTTFNELVAIPSAFVTPEHTYRARVRHKDDTGRWSQWSLPVEFRPSAADLGSLLRSSLVFSEIMYNPPAEGTVDGDEFEFLELKNIGAAPVDLTGLYFSAGINFAFTNGTTLPPGALFLLARNPTALRTRHTSVVVNGTYTGKLDNGGETVAISHPQAGVVLSVTYGDRPPWPVAADGYGFSLVLADPATARYASSATRLGTPGADAPPSNLGGVVINEVLSSSTSPLQDAVELKNVSTAPVDISGWYLSDSPSFPWKFRIPAGTILSPGDYAVFTEAHFNATPGLGTSFAFSGGGDDAYLFSANAAGELTGYSHGFEFGTAPSDVSIGRYVNSQGEEEMVLQSARTFGAANASPRIGPVVVSEIHYRPPGASNSFVELRNLTSSAVPLFDPAYPTNTWSLSGYSFVFPPNITLPANGMALVVSDDPAAFRTRHNVPVSVQIFASAGTLQNNGERLELRVPSPPTTNGVRYYAIDAVRYDNLRPWPLAADGAGASLQRIILPDYGNDPTNWAAATPTPGSPRVVSGTAPRFITSPVAQSGAAGGFASFDALAAGSEPMRYQWRFLGTNISGATNTSLLLANLLLSDTGLYSVIAFNGVGSAESAEAPLLVRVGATITNQPVNALVRVRPDPFAAPSTNVTFTVGASSFNPPLRYQWQFNEINLPGATNASITITNVQLTDEGKNRALVTDGIGSVVSSNAALVPLISPTLLIAPIAQSVPVGGELTVSAEVLGNPLPLTMEWRRGTSVTLASNVVNERISFMTLPAAATPSSQPYRFIVRSLAGILNYQFIITTVADTDGDGIPDEVETAYGSNPNSAADRDLDSDGDGMTNWEEYRAGTNPTNAASRLALTATRATGAPLLSFNLETNRTYSLLYSDALGTPWIKLRDFMARTNAGPEQIADPTGATNRFYRVVTPRRP